MSGLQQTSFVVKVKRAHADARHRGHLLDCVSHRSDPPPYLEIVPNVEGSRNVRVKHYFALCVSFWKQETGAPEVRFGSHVAGCAPPPAGPILDQVAAPGVFA